ncbi:MAG: helix-turn-helix domain-containing protein [Gordonia sp. (in: high G+C Gram-positive bacteria)]
MTTTLRISNQVRGEAAAARRGMDGGERLALTVPGGTAFPLPVELADVLAKALSVMADGGTVSIASLPNELSTTEAARQLGVSRPTVMKWIADGSLPAHKVKSHHRLFAADVLSFGESRRADQMAALGKLREIDEELGLNN